MTVTEERYCAFRVVDDSAEPVEKGATAAAAGQIVRRPFGGEPHICVVAERTILSCPPMLALQLPALDLLPQLA
eukprot:scaffold3630_cov306-Prasinococcus_capsulatus_cf.AAC.8